jgi:GNAT superfamily N-acetyltransferase
VDVRHHETGEKYSMNVKIAENNKEILGCFDVMSELRTNLVKDEFVSQVREQELEGFKLAYIEDGGIITGVAGFRVSSNLCFGKNLYVDDLVTTEHGRSKGYGSKLVEWLREYALELDCTVLRLDSGTHRDKAHKFYFASGFSISDFHFYMQLK